MGAIEIVLRLLVERQTFVIALFHEAWIPLLFPTNNVAKIKYIERVLAAGLKYRMSIVLRTVFSKW
jgi:hypothetical protein